MTDDTQILCNLLRDSISSDSVVRDNSTRRILEAENQSGFCLALINIYAHPDVDLQTRFLAISLCKNIIPRIWRNIEGDRSAVKSRIVEVLSQLASVPHINELCILMRRIGRFEFPSNWPEIANWINSVTDSLNGTFELNTVVIDAIHIIQQMIKEQETKKLMAGRKDSFAFCPQILQKLLQPWEALSQRIIGTSSTPTDPVWKCSRYLDGCICVLAHISYPKLHEVPFGPRLVEQIIGKLQFLLTQVTRDNQHTYLYKNMKSLYKWATNILYSHSPSFSGNALIPYLSVCETTLRIPSIRTSNIAVYAITSITNIISSYGSETTTNQLSLQGRSQMDKYFNTTTPITTVWDEIISVGLRLSDEDLDEWYMSPDESAQGALDGTPLRQATEMFITTTKQGCIYSKQLLLHGVLTLGRALSGPVDTLHLDALMAWFALIYDNKTSLIVDCNDILRRVVELLQCQQHSPILAYRALQIMRAVVPTIKHDDFPMLLATVVDCGSSNRPVCVRVGAWLALRVAWDKRSDHPEWEKYCNKIMSDGIDLLGKITAPDFMWRVLNMIGTIASTDYVSHSVSEIACSQLLNIWNLSKGQEMIRLALIDVFKSISAHSTTSNIRECSLNIVQDALQGTSESEQESALLLLESTVRGLSYPVDPRTSNVIQSIVGYYLGNTIPVDLQTALVGTLSEYISIFAEEKLSSHNVNINDWILPLLQLVDQLLQSDDSPADKCFELLELLVYVSESIEPFAPLLIRLCSHVSVATEEHSIERTAIVQFLLTTSVRFPNEFVYLCAKNCWQIASQLLLQIKDFKRPLLRASIVSAVCLIIEDKSDCPTPLVHALIQATNAIVADIKKGSTGTRMGSLMQTLRESVNGERQSRVSRVIAFCRTPSELSVESDDDSIARWTVSRMLKWLNKMPSECEHRRKLFSQDVIDIMHDLDQ